LSEVSRASLMRDAGVRSKHRLDMPAEGRSKNVALEADSAFLKSPSVKSAS